MRAATLYARATGTFLFAACGASLIRGAVEVLRYGGRLLGWQGSPAYQAIGFAILVIPFHLIFGLPVALTTLALARRLKLTRLNFIVLAATLGAFTEVFVIQLPGAMTLGQSALEFVAAQPLWIAFAVLAPIGVDEAPDWPNAFGAGPE
jgi:hypothetical protein